MKPDRFYISEIASFPKLASLIEAAESCVSKSRLDTLTQDCRPQFEDLLKSDELQKIIHRQLEIAATGDTLHPIWMSPTAEEWFIVERKEYSLRLFVAKPSKKGSFQSLKHDCLAGNLSGPSFRINLYKFPEGVRRDVFRPGVQAQACGTVDVPKGSAYLLRGDMDIPDYEIHAPVLTLILYPKQYTPVVWCFDKISQLSNMATASCDPPVRRQVAATMLREIHEAEDVDPEASLETLSKMTTALEHFVRWTAIQSMCAIDFDFAKPYLIKACDDPHPSVSEAAKRAVAKYLAPA